MNKILYQQVAESINLGKLGYRKYLGSFIKLKQPLNPYDPNTINEVNRRIVNDSWTILSANAMDTLMKHSTTPNTLNTIKFQLNKTSTIDFESSVESFFSKTCLFLLLDPFCESDNDQTIIECNSVSLIQVPWCKSTRIVPLGTSFFYDASTNTIKLGQEPPVKPKQWNIQSPSLFFSVKPKSIISVPPKNEIYEATTPPDSPCFESDLCNSPFTSTRFLDQSSITNESMIMKDDDDEYLDDLFNPSSKLDFKLAISITSSQIPEAFSSSSSTSSSTCSSICSSFNEDEQTQPMYSTNDESHPSFEFPSLTPLSPKSQREAEKTMREAKVTQRQLELTMKNLIKNHSVMKKISKKNKRIKK